MMHTQDLCDKEKSKTHTSIIYRHSTQKVFNCRRYKALSGRLAKHTSKCQQAPRSSGPMVALYSISETIYSFEKPVNVQHGQGNFA